MRGVARLSEKIKQTTAWARAHKERAAATQKRSHERMLLKLTTHKESLGCSVCGYNKCGAALDWHHVDSSTKERRISVRTYFSKLGEAERAKCVLLCSNCHRELHWKERESTEI